MKSLLVLFTIYLINVQITEAAEIVFWSNTEFGGERYHVNMERGKCYKLGVSNDRISSMDTNGHCVDLYTRNDCFGGNFRLGGQTAACHRNFGECDMNDKISSLRLCARNSELCDRDADDQCNCNCNCNGEKQGTYNY